MIEKKHIQMDLVDGLSQINTSEKALDLQVGQVSLAMALRDLAGNEGGLRENWDVRGMIFHRVQPTKIEGRSHPQAISMTIKNGLSEQTFFSLQQPFIMFFEN